MEYSIWIYLSGASSEPTLPEADLAAPALGRFPNMKVLDKECALNHT